MKKFIVTLTDEERVELQRLIRRGKGAARKLARARILLKADEREGWTDVAICEAFDVGVRTVERLRQRFVEQGLEACLNPPSQPRMPRVVDGQVEAHLVALACSEPPEGAERWTLRLLAGRMVEREYVSSISHETVRQTLKKNELKPWRNKSWCPPQAVCNPASPAAETERRLRLPDGRCAGTVPAAV